jgi:phosphohistidine phosphatase
MEVLLIRHAIAVDHDAAPSDAERPLTRRGVKRFRLAVRGLERLGLALDHVLHSPWLRAVQTAELLTPVLAGRPERVLQPTPLLTQSPGEALLALAEPFPTDARIAFVGHEPWMGEQLSLLITGTIAHAENLRFKKGGVAWLDGEPRAGGMVLRSMLPPSVLRRIRKGP